MTFTVQYPVFVVGKKSPDDVALVDLMNGNQKAKGVAIFTDREGAEEFRDRYHKSFGIIPLPDEQHLANLLAVLKSLISEVVFDPYQIGKRTQTITVAEMLVQLP